MSRKAEAVPPDKHSRVSMRFSFAALLAQLSPRRRRQLGLVFCLMLIGAVAELVSIGAVVPLLAVISDPTAAARHGNVEAFLMRLGIDTPVRIAAAAAIFFALAALGAAAARLLLAYASQRLVSGVARDLSVSLFNRTLHQPYAYHTGKNTSETLAAINKAQLVAGQVLMPLMQAASAAVIGAAILVGLLLIDPMVALGAAFCFGAIYLAVMRTTRAVMLNNGKTIAKTQAERLQVASEALGGIRDVLLDRSQPAFISRFAATEARLRNAQALSNFIGQAPRFVVEGLGLAVIAGLALLLTLRDGGIVAALPVLGALALGAQRLIPLIQVLYHGWASTLSAGPMLVDILDILKLPEGPRGSNQWKPQRLTFETDLLFRNVGFSYPHSPGPALADINLLVAKGARVGIAGRTGSGKSTLMDLVLGLISPDTGQILVDGVALADANRSAWQARIAHVPQSIYLSDASIAENIAFGVPPGEIDHHRVAAAATQAELSDVIEALPQGYRTLVGERGVRLSGGQRQRVGIARALYKQADVIVFDEATSALDTGTEAAVMKAIESLGRDLTILIIAHRLSTLEGCDVLVTLESGRVQSISMREEARRVFS